MNQLFLVFYVFNGDCNSNAAQEKAKTNFQNLGLLPAGASRDEIEVHCGATSVKRRRRRRSTKQLSFRIKLKVSATKEQAIANPSQTITDLKNTMNNNIAPAFLSNINSRTDWSKLSSDIQSLEKPPRKEGNPTEACAQQEEVFDKQQSKTTEKCGKSACLILNISISESDWFTEFETTWCGPWSDIVIQLNYWFKNWFATTEITYNGKHNKVVVIQGWE